jgi:hypothetical protein
MSWLVKFIKDGFIVTTKKNFLEFLNYSKKMPCNRTHNWRDCTCELDPAELIAMFIVFGSIDIFSWIRNKIQNCRKNKELL